MTQKRFQASNALGNHKPTNATKSKGGFMISSPVDDDDEWVSSEAGSGAPTPDDSSDEEEDSSPERSKTPVKTPVGEDVRTPAVEEVAFISATPRAEPNISRVNTARPTEQQRSMKCVPSHPSNLSRVQEPNPQPQASHHRRQYTESQIIESRSETTSPNGHSHNRHNADRRASVTRPPSMHSVRTDVPLRPHPLIRGNSYGQGAAVAAGIGHTLTPLTVISTSSAAQLSSSPPEVSSPTNISTTYAHPEPNRRTSISSARSVVTLPVSPQQPSKYHDRNRTLSAMSTSSTQSSFAALTSLAHSSHSHTQTRPPTPSLTSFFPPANPHVNQDLIHPLLPPPYLGAHLTVLATRGPIREAFERVGRAKQGL